MARTEIRLTGIHSIELNVHEARSWLDYLSRGLGFQRVAASTGASVEQTGTRRHLLACGDVRMVVAEPVHLGSVVRRFLEKHPEGISQVNFAVPDVREVEACLLERHATCTSIVTDDKTDRGDWRQINIATPLGDVEFAFVESSDAARLSMPDMEPCADFNESQNPLGITGIDHLTSNVRTLMPVIAFYEHVLGFRRVRDMRFHTDDVQTGVGGGLTCVVMGHEGSGIRIATNEPLRPRFDQSQVQMSVDTNRGPGVQQIAFAVHDLVRAADTARNGGVGFLPTPAAYYQLLPDRLKAQGCGAIRERIEALAAHGILADGEKGGYLLQLFLRDQAGQFGRPSAGPLLVELIQRAGCQGFGEGNFKAIYQASRLSAFSTCG